MCQAWGKKSFAQATNSQVRELIINVEELKILLEEITIDGNMVIMELLQEKIEEEKKRTYNNREHKKIGCSKK